MEKSISAAHAARKFSQILREVIDGQSYVVTIYGRPVARIAPLEQSRPRIRARNALMRRLRSQRILEIGRWKREDLYE